MSKIFKTKVDLCNECGYLNDSLQLPYCGHLSLRKKIYARQLIKYATTDNISIPDWCPLEDYDECWESAENPPKQIGNYIGFSQSANEVMWLFYNSDKKWCFENSYRDDITLWRELPKLPKRNK